jgi:DNA mismatch repair ATPase MutS
MQPFCLSEYLKKIELYKSELKVLEKTFLALYFIRLITFVGFISFLIWYANAPGYWFLAVISVILVVGFLLVVKKDFTLVTHQKLLQKKLLVNQNELKYYTHNFQEFFDGTEFLKLDPHLAGDFDLFGEDSLFQYLNRSVTNIGSGRLSENLCKWSLDKSQVIRRQEGIRELSEKPIFMESFQSKGMLIAETGDEQSNLLEWINESERTVPYLKKIIWMYPVALLALIILSVLGLLPYGVLWLPVVAALFICDNKKKLIDDAHNKLGGGANTFRKYATLIEMIETENFSSQYLQDQKSKLSKNGLNASNSLRRLFLLLEKFDFRFNLIIRILFNVLFLFELQIYYRLIIWKKQHQDVVGGWFEAMAEVDALIGFARFACNNKNEVVYPDVEDEGFCFSAKAMGHPLIKLDVRINNDVEFYGQPKVMVVTGANMAGKSTFLRMFVVNLIMAMNGAPVCAKSFRFTPCDIMSSINIRDSLSHQASYFYSELVRIREIIDHVKMNPKTLVVLDEILRGTNTKDKQVGSVGLLEKLISMDSIVVVATHDLTIGELAKKHPDIVTNHCFEVELEDDQLIFDYKLKNGISQKLNASFLMRKMGVID